MSSGRKMHVGKVQFCRKTPSMLWGCLQMRVRMLTGWDVCAQDVRNEAMAAKYRASSHRGLLGTLGSSDVRSSGHPGRERWQADSEYQLRELKEPLCNHVTFSRQLLRQNHRILVVHVKICNPNLSVLREDDYSRWAPSQSANKQMDDAISATKLLYWFPFDLSGDLRLKSA